jgi:hypothetical protein
MTDTDVTIHWIMGRNFEMSGIILYIRCSVLSKGTALLPESTMVNPVQTAYDANFESGKDGEHEPRTANMNNGTSDQLTSPELQQEGDVLPGGGQVELDSVTLKRLLTEVRNEEAFEPASYNRQHNRHNRTR